jgi:hypothetical protein
MAKGRMPKGGPLAKMLKQMPKGGPKDFDDIKKG